MFDVVISGGRVVDGTGAPAIAAEIAISGDRIVVIGTVEGEAERRIDAQGRVVSPGFIDLHTHSDFSFFIDPLADSKTTQGVTFELVGNCGISFCAPLIGESFTDLESRVSRYDTRWRPNWTSFASYLDGLEQAGGTLNIATQVGHGTIRKAVLGTDTRAPSLEQLKRMQALVAEALEAGALGFSTGLSMAPGSYSIASEINALTRVTAQHGKLYSTHMRDSQSESAGLFVATEEAIEAARRDHGRVQLSHIKANGPLQGSGERLLEMIERARREGLDVAADQYPYIAASGPMSGNVYPRWAQEGGYDKAIERARDADLRMEINAELRGAIQRIGGPQRISIASFPPTRHFEGMTVEEVAREMRCDVGEALIQMFEKYDTQLILEGMAQRDVDVIARGPDVAVGSDGSSLRTTGPLSEGNPHPRSYGTFPRFLATYVRGKKQIPLEESIRKMTSLPADRLQLTRRGRLAPGYFADIAIFDDSTVEDRATFAKPHVYSVGVDEVLVNGVSVVSGGKTTGARPGRVIRGPGG